MPSNRAGTYECPTCGYKYHSKGEFRFEANPPHCPNEGRLLTFKPDPEPVLADRLAMTESRTARGFQLVEFNDYYANPCSFQQSSLALCEPPGSSAVWLGQGENRMHLEQRQVEELVKRLQRWLETGKIHLGGHDDA